MQLLTLLLLLMATCACVREPDSYPPPEQRHPEQVTAPVRASMLIHMSDETAPSSFVKDISSTLEGGSWRWVGKRPTVKILLVKSKDLKFTTDFTIWEGAMAQTGPVTISFFINDHLLDRVRYDTPGYKHFEKLVPGEWLNTTTETIAAAEIDKMYVAPEDGVKLGFILSNIGFVRR